MTEYDPVFRLAHDYGTHLFGCEILADGTSDNCTCGFREALDAAQEYVANLVFCPSSTVPLVDQGAATTGKAT